MDTVVKVCKKHGELSIENTYLLKIKSGNKIRMCSICKKGYRTDWGKRNPEKVKVAQEKAKEQRLIELANGTLQKNCHRHGELHISKIRVDARGTRICRLCGNEDKIKSKKKVDPTNEKYKAWLYSDRERVQRYRKQDSPNRRKRQNRSYHRLKVTNPEKHKMKQKQKNVYSRKYCKRLDDSYINSLLRTFRTGGRKNKFYLYLKGASFPKELIDLVKEQIKLRRKLRGKNVKNNNNESST
ncbi:MAG: hypothetical protein AABY22_22580 [Nanoarchaeota archaeon]